MDDQMCLEEEETVKPYAVMFTYLPENESAVYLFQDLESASAFLQSNIEQLLKVEQEENIGTVEFRRDASWKWARIIHRLGTCGEQDEEIDARIGIIYS